MSNKLGLAQAAEMSAAMLAGDPEALKHRDWKRTVDLAKRYKQLVTGEDMDDLYIAYNPRETEADRKQSIRLTNPLPPAVCAALSTPLLKLANVPAQVNEIKGIKATAIDLLNGKIDSIYGDNDLSAMFGQRFLQDGIIDPNAFVVWSFEDGDDSNLPIDRGVYAEVQPSSNVYNFEYKGGVLRWLLIHKGIKYPRKGSDANPVLVDGDRYILYTSDHHIQFTQVDKDTIITSSFGAFTDAFGVQVTIDEGAAGGVFYFRRDQNTLFEVRVFEQRSSRVPAFRLGYKRDAHTNGRTMVNLWHAAYWHLRRLVKLGRENDLSYVLHAFLQKFSYVGKCPAMGCNGGRLAADDICGTCKGSGKMTHTTASDNIELTLPAQPEKAMFDLAKMVHYATVPTDILGIQDKKIDETIKAAFQAVYNSDIFVVNTSAETATGKRIDMQSVYDALQDAASWWSAAYMDSGYIIASYHDLWAKELAIIHRFPRDFRFDTASDLILKLKEARDIPGTEAYKIALTHSLNVQQFQDDPFQLRRVQTMTRFDPFVGKTDDTIMSIFSQGLTTKFNKVLWSNMPEVFDLAEEAAIEGKTFFYDLAPAKQREIISGIVEGMIEAIDGAKEPAPEPIGGLGVEEEEQEEEQEDTGEEEVEVVAGEETTEQAT